MAMTEDDIYDDSIVMSLPVTGESGRIRRNRSSKRRSDMGVVVMMTMTMTILHHAGITSAFTLRSGGAGWSPATRPVVRPSTPLFADATQPRKITPLAPAKRKYRGPSNSTNDGFDHDRALLSSIAMAARMDATVASVYRPKGRPESVPGAMNKSTLMHNLDAEARADELVASGRLNPNNKDALINLARAEKRELDRQKYYDTVEVEEEEGAPSHHSRLPTVFYKEAQEVEQMWSGGGGTATPKPVKRGRGRPRKDATTTTRTPPQRSQPLTAATTPHNNVEVDGSGSTTFTQTPKRRARSKQVRKRDPTRKRGKLRGDKISLQKYYDTELLTASEEYSLGMQVQFLMRCEAVYDGLTVVRNPTIAEWAYACGYQEPDALSEDGYVESRLESSIRPSACDMTALDVDEDGPQPGARFKGNGLEKLEGVGRGRGRKNKPPPVCLPPYFDDSLSKFPHLIEEWEDGDHLADFPLQLQRSSLQTPINYGTPTDFCNMLLTSKESKQRMVECNMRLVISIARRYNNVGVNVQDLVQEGSLGLFRATEKFDPSKGFKFSTYASWWIQQAVFRAIAYHSRTIRLPVHVHNLLNRVRRIKTTMQQDLGRPPSDIEIAAELEMTPEKYNKMMHLTKNTVSLEKPKYRNNPKDLGHESDASLGDTIDSSATIKDDNTPEQTVDEGLFQDDLKDMLQILGPDEKRVISARYGLEDGLTRTVTAVAVQLRQTKSWVRSQECRALRKLRRPWYEKRLMEHQNSLTGR